MSSQAELLLAVQLEQAGIPFEREYHFAPEEWCKAHGFLTPTGLPRRWRADFIVPAQDKDVGDGWREFTPALLVEIDGGGYVGGRHSTGKGIEDDAEKASAAAILGYRVIRLTPKQVEDGRALAWIKAALGNPVAA